MGLGPTKRIGDWVSAPEQQTGFARLDAETFPSFEAGWVWLVGAGPGAPGLMSLMCYHALQSCDVVVYDALVNPDILRWVKVGAELEYAGKRGGKPSPTQKDITLRLIELAQSGKRVLRLKGGDPFMFGRGGEECQHLATSAIPFRIVPGTPSERSASLDLRLLVDEIDLVAVGDELLSGARVNTNAAWLGGVAA